MTGTYPAYFEDGPLAGQLLDMMREATGGPSALIVTHRAPKLDLNPDAGHVVPDRVVYYLNRKGKVAGGAHDGLELYVYREGDDPDEQPTHPEHQEPTA